MLTIPEHSCTEHFLSVHWRMKVGIKILQYFSFKVFSLQVLEPWDVTTTSKVAVIAVTILRVLVNSFRDLLYWSQHRLHCHAHSSRNSPYKTLLAVPSSIKVKKQNELLNTTLQPYELLKFVLPGVPVLSGKLPLLDCALVNTSFYLVLHCKQFLNGPVPNIIDNF